MSFGGSKDTLVTCKYNVNHKVLQSKIKDHNARVHGTHDRRKKKFAKNSKSVDDDYCFERPFPGIVESEPKCFEREFPGRSELNKNVTTRNKAPEENEEGSWDFRSNETDYGGNGYEDELIDSEDDMMVSDRINCNFGDPAKTKGRQQGRSDDLSSAAAYGWKLPTDENQSLTERSRQDNDEEMRVWRMRNEERQKFSSVRKDGYEDSASLRNEESLERARLRFHDDSESRSSSLNSLNLRFQELNRGLSYSQSTTPPEISPREPQRVCQRRFNRENVNSVLLDGFRYRHAIPESQPERSGFLFKSKLEKLKAEEQAKRRGN